MKTIMKATDVKNQIEAKIITTDKGFALIVRDLEANELITRVNAADIAPLLVRFNKFQAEALKAS